MNVICTAFRIYFKPTFLNGAHWSQLVESLPQPVLVDTLKPVLARELKYDREYGRNLQLSVSLSDRHGNIIAADLPGNEPIQEDSYLLVCRTLSQKVGLLPITLSSIATKWVKTANLGYEQINRSLCSFCSLDTKLLVIVNCSHENDKIQICLKCFINSKVILYNICLICGFVHSLNVTNSDGKSISDDFCKQLHSLKSQSLDFFDRCLSVLDVNKDHEDFMSDASERRFDDLVLMDDGNETLASCATVPFDNDTDYVQSSGESNQACEESVPAPPSTPNEHRNSKQPLHVNMQVYRTILSQDKIYNNALSIENFSKPLKHHIRYLVNVDTCNLTLPLLGSGNMSSLVYFFALPPVSFSLLMQLDYLVLEYVECSKLCQTILTSELESVYIPLLCPDDSSQVQCTGAFSISKVFTIDLTKKLVLNMLDKTKCSQTSKRELNQSSPRLINDTNIAVSEAITDRSSYELFSEAKPVLENALNAQKADTCMKLIDFWLTEQQIKKSSLSAPDDQLLSNQTKFLILEIGWRRKHSSPVQIHQKSRPFLFMKNSITSDGKKFHPDYNSISIVPSNFQREFFAKLNIPYNLLEPKVVDFLTIYENNLKVLQKRSELQKVKFLELQRQSCIKVSNAVTKHVSPIWNSLADRHLPKEWTGINPLLPYCSNWRMLSESDFDRIKSFQLQFQEQLLKLNYIDEMTLANQNFTSEFPLNDLKPIDYIIYSTVVQNRQKLYQPMYAPPANNPVAPPAGPYAPTWSKPPSYGISGQMPYHFGRSAYASHYAAAPSVPSYGNYAPQRVIPPGLPKGINEYAGAIPTNPGMAKPNLSQQYPAYAQSSTKQAKYYQNSNDFNVKPYYHTANSANTVSNAPTYTSSQIHPPNYYSTNPSQADYNSKNLPNPPN